jgi:hypothetical protein
MKTIKIKTDYGEWKEIEVSDESFKSIEKETRPKFKVGDWVYCAIHNAPYPVRRIESLSGRCGRDKYGGIHLEDCSYRHAASEEIKEHLIKEAEKRGFKEGLPLGKVNPREYSYSGVITSDEWDYDIDQDWLRCVGATIYWKGEWAEIVEDDTIKIGDYDVDVTAHSVKVGCQKVDFNTVKKIYKQMKKLRK